MAPDRETVTLSASQAVARLSPIILPVYLLTEPNIA